MTTAAAAKRPPDKADLPNKPPAVVRPVKLRAIDREFLPAALEILETPASPVGTVLILIICAFVVIALTWSYIGKVDIIAIAQGKLQPTGRVKTIQALETSRVLDNHVQNGMHVNKDDILVELDPRDAQADEAAASAELASYKAETIRRTAAMEMARTGQVLPIPVIDWPDSIPLNNRINEDQVLKSDLVQLGAQTASLKAQAEQKKTERAQLRETIASQNKLIDTLHQRVAMRYELIDRGAGSKASLLDSVEALQREETALARDNGQLAEIESNLAVIDRDIQKCFDTFVADNAQKYTEAQRQVASLLEKVVRAKIRSGQTAIRSPISGIIQASSLTTVGQVVTPSEELMRIVPDGAALEVECYLPNKDIGFVKEGQAAVIKVEAFPFTRYGSINATVMRVAHDAIPEPEAQQAEQNLGRANRNETSQGAERVQNLVFPVTLRLEKAIINVDGMPVPLQPGMAVIVEMRTGSRRILEYVLSPLAQVQSEALHER